jgi:SNF2 family DNA or RNA helicase
MSEFVNPIDKDKVAENPGLLPYAHSVGGPPIKPEDKGKLKTRALSAMREQTNRQMNQIQKQVELMIAQANEIKRRIEISEDIYTADMGFEPLVSHTYHLYKRIEDDKNVLMVVGPDEWGKNRKESLEFKASVRLMADHTWEILEDYQNFV